MATTWRKKTLRVDDNKTVRKPLKYIIIRSFDVLVENEEQGTSSEHIRVAVFHRPQSFPSIQWANGLKQGPLGHLVYISERSPTHVEREIHRDHSYLVFYIHGTRQQCMNSELRVFASTFARKAQTRSSNGGTELCVGQASRRAKRAEPFCR